MPYEDFNAGILKAGELTATVIRKRVEGWFQFSSDELAPMLKERDQLLHRVRQESNEEAIEQLKLELAQKKRCIHDAISIAKAKY